ncbi:hydrogenase isoenzymes nickel incorporation protein HypB [Clostridium acetireducens DSM 10703]|uniref:Hydrogenase isoenzymes nickel incorporation protein HypB n=1 Tax=Clostridium acetireducens DSM 10703 TaxID=1121290 RepID=A0A1E8F0Y8_9CLOT|nr:hydrogenase nickel incorporation protein HypB [Clostridium acetireducens]OFI07119.1 hydrogenase isoenzymes nickel incorporation protein HypB [Clostridium acetireducens DSM 10703]
MKKIILEKSVLENNDKIAEKNRKRLNNKKVFAINLVGTPGAGKTSVLENLIPNIQKDFNMAVIEGDLYTAKDAKRIEKHNVEVVQLNTQGACHLDANMIEKSLEHINMKNLDFLVIENIGNLVCPAEFDLSEDMKVMVMSITEGNDKPLKYPLMFQRSSVIILNKIDMIHLTDFNLEEFYKDVISLNKDAHIFEVSCRTGEGIEKLSKYLIDNINSKRNCNFRK